MNKQLSNKIIKKLLPKTTNNSDGFTLVELLVTISILAILAVIGFAIFQDAQKRARDARRRTEVISIANAWEVQYNETTASYPTPIDPTWFSGNEIPEDPLFSTGSNRKCGGTNTLLCKYCYKPNTGAAATSGCSDTDTPISKSNTLNGLTAPASFYVCANLEKPVSATAPNYICQANRR